MSRSQVHAGTAFVSQLMHTGAMASAEFNALADIALDQSLRGCDDFDDGILVSGLSRPTDHKKAESFYRLTRRKPS